MKITAKEILADKGNIYKNMSEDELVLFLKTTMLNNINHVEYSKLIKLIFKDTFGKISAHVAKKLWQRWHYKDGRPKPPRVHEVTRLREKVKRCQEVISGDIEIFTKLKGEIAYLKKYKNKLLEDQLQSLEKFRNYEKQNHLKNIDIINLQGELSKAHNTTKIVAFVSLVIIIGLILIPYLN